MKKWITSFTLAGFCLLGFGNCFGKFGLTRSIYSIHAGISIGSGKWAGFFRSLLLLFPFSFGYYFAFLFDILLFNLIEFWTGGNPISQAPFDQEGKRVTKWETPEGETLQVTEVSWGKQWEIEVQQKGKVVHLRAFQDKPGQIFQKENGIWTNKIGSEGPLPYRF